jgi:GDSL-like Lipase/Acylhydrolase family
MRSRFTAIDWLVVLSFLAVGGWVYVGFWYPDRYVYGWTLVFVLHGIRLFLPVALLALAYLYYRIRTGRTKLANVAILGVSLLLGALVLYPVATEMHFQEKFLHKDKRLYHPYLQISPPDFKYKNRSNSSGTRPYRIFCLGGSTTEYADSLGKDWPSRVEENIQGVLGDRPIEVYNCGREWYTSLHQLINFQFNLRQYKPDMIVLLHGINDLWINCDFNSQCSGPFRADYGHYDGPVARLVNRKSLFGSATHFLSSMWYFPDRKDLVVDSFPGLEPYENYLRTCIELARNDGIQVVLMTQPHIFREGMDKEKHPYLFMYEFNGHNNDVEWSLETAHRGIIQYNQKVREVAVEEGSFLIDLENSIPEEHDHFRDDVHYTMAGFDHVGERVSEGLREIFMNQVFGNLEGKHGEANRPNK